MARVMALVDNPDGIVADEPTGELDSESGRKVIDLLISLNKKMGKSMIIVTHQEEISNRCRRRIRLKDGRIL